MRRNNVFYLLINKHKKIFLVLISFFMIGLILGIIFVNTADNEQKNSINEYVNNMILNVKSFDNVDKVQLLKQSLKNNLKIVLAIFLLGCTAFFGILIYAVVIYKGFSIGYTISAIIACLGVQKRDNMLCFISTFAEYYFYSNDDYSFSKWDKFIL